MIALDIVWQELANERDELQSKVTTLENDIAMRDQQLQEYQQRIDQLSQEHKAAVDEGNTLRQQMESLNKLVMSWCIVLPWEMFCCSYRSADQVRLGQSVHDNPYSC